MRTYRIRHSTGYFYDHPVMRSRNLCLLLPRYLSYQTVLYESLVVNPEPEPAFELDDGLGNRLYDFTVVKPHINFEVVLDLRVTIQERIWKEGCAKLGDALYLQSDYHNSSHLEASIFTFPSRHVVWDDEIEELCAPLRAAHAPPHECAQSLMELIHREWKFQAGVTHIQTSVSDLLHHKVGVCQDFTHLMLAALRHLGIPARYVSGYLETLPKPGKPKLVGADVSHAWVQAYDPIAGWKDFDPTNNLIPGERHITLAFGRDFGDISPLRGLVSGGGQQKMKVSVDVVAEERADEGLPQMTKPMPTVNPE